MPVASEIYYHAYEGAETEMPPVVLIHGAGGNHLYWPPEVRRLTGYRVYAVDLPGHGKSEGCGQQSVGAYAAQLMDWLAAIGLHRAVFVGHSMGGAIALALAIHHPENVAGLGLVASGARLRVHPDILSAVAYPATFHKAIEIIVAYSFSPAADARLVELAAQRMAETRPSVLHGDLLACNEFDVMEHLSGIRQPTLVACGTEDQLTPLRYSQFLADSIPGARLEVIPQAGHMAMLEQPQAVAAALASFLSGVRYRPGEA